MLAFIVTMTVTLLVFLALCQITGVPITWYMAAGAVLPGVFVAYAAMFGFNKLKRTMEHINNTKKE